MNTYKSQKTSNKSDCIYTIKYSLPKPKSFDILLKRLKDVHKLKINLKNKEWNELVIRNVNYNELKNYAKAARYITKETINHKNYKFKSNVSLKNIYDLYLFDIKLKNILIYSIGIIEKNLRTTISNVLSNEINDTECVNFDLYSCNPTKTEDIIKQTKKRIYNSFSKNQLYDEEIIEYITKMSMHFPIWNLIESFSFGQLYYFFKYLKDPIKFKIVKYYNTDIRRFENHIASMNHVRNICSHFNRLLGKRLNDLSSDKSLGIDDTNRITLFSFIKMACKFLKCCDSKQYEIVIIRLRYLFDHNQKIIKDLNLLPGDWLKWIKI